MLGAMQDWELRVSLLIDHAAREYGSREIVTRWNDNSESRTILEAQIERYAQLMVEARNVKAMLAMLGQPIKSANDAAALVQDPVQVMAPIIMLQSNTPDPIQAQALYLQSKGWDPQTYIALTQEFAPVAQPFGALIKTESNLYRLRARARVGNITRTVFAVLKRDGKIIRTLYYREE